MNTYSERLEQALLLSGQSRKELCKAVGVTLQALGQVLAGKTKALTSENSARAARFLCVDHYWLATGEGHPLTHEYQSWPFGDYARYEALSPSKKAELHRLVDAFLMGAAPDMKSRERKAA